MGAQVDTIFDKILRKEIPAHIVFENEQVLAFNDINPVAPVHVLVISKVKRESLRDIKQASDSELSAFMRGLSEVASSLGLDKKGYRVVINNGPDAQQSVAYLHAHIIAGKQLGWPPG